MPLTSAGSWLQPYKAGGAAQGLGKWRALCTGAVNDDSDEGATIRNMVGRAANAHHRRVHEMIGAEYGYSYAGSPIIDGKLGDYAHWDIVRFVPSVVPGVRLPHIWLKDRTAIQDLMGREFSYIDLTGYADCDPVSEAFSILGVPLTIISRDEVHVRGVYGCKFLLVRPDLHIAWTGNSMPENILALATLVTGKT